MRITLNDLPTSMTKKMADQTTFDSAMPLSYIASHYPDVRKCQSGISNPRRWLGDYFYIRIFIYVCNRLSAYV